MYCAVRETGYKVSTELAGDQTVKPSSRSIKVLKTLFVHVLALPAPGFDMLQSLSVKGFRLNRKLSTAREFFCEISVEPVKFL
jgi:hypothetical protein